MFTNSSKYAIKALCVIVEQTSTEHKLLVKEIAEQTGIPKPFLSKILQQLSSKNYISSTKGRHGGFYIEEEQLENSLLDIIIEVEGKNRLQRCAINFEECDYENPCPIHKFITTAKNELQENIKNIKLKDLRNHYGSLHIEMDSD
ncbi:MAG: Rrf2 family transcriptional regulator [Flavobacteriaceae bacterium]|nr:Rrf2 family transcriptional regulator [Flavobacteriaceae bacterium]